MKKRELKVECPSCEKKVDRVDGEYARHNTRGNLCLLSKREIVGEKRRQ